MKIIASLVGLFLIVAPLSVSADAWWGKGYKPPEWVLSNGGSIIRYNIKGTQKTHKYKAFLRKNGKYVEVEFGDHATFDDAKDGVYTVTFYKCDDSCTPHSTNNKTKVRSSDDKKASVTVTARPGETTYVVFDVRTGSAYIEGVKTLSGGDGLAKTPPKPQYTREQLIGFAAERQEGQSCERPDAHPFVTQTFTFPEKKQ